jgi:pSer/pThr/pTyr-binding forkhead associated (FHA) protein
MDVKLIVIEGDISVKEVQVTLPSVIGRGRDAGVTLRHPLISRRHCELFESDGRMHVRDLNSLNGTYVDHNNIDEAIVPSGSLLTVGGFTFKVEYEDAGEPANTVHVSSDASTISSGDDLAAAFEKMTGDLDSVDTEPVLAATEEEPQADLELGSLMDLAEAEEDTEGDTEIELNDPETPPAAPVPEVAPEVDVIIEDVGPPVQSVSDEIDLDAMFSEDLATSTPEVTEEPMLDLEEVAEPVMDLEEVAEPVMDLEEVAEPVSEPPAPVASPEVEIMDLGLVELEELEELPEGEALADKETPADAVDELEIVDPPQQAAPAKDDDDDLNSFLNKLK